MSKLSRTKGKVFERQVARQLGKLWPGATVHRSSQADRAYHADVVIEGDAPMLALRLWLELNDARDPQPLKKLAQAERDIAAIHWFKRPHSALPVVVWHRLAERTVWATMRASTLCVLLRAAPDQTTLNEALVAMALTLEEEVLPVTVDWALLLTLPWARTA